MMTADNARHARLEVLLAKLLDWETWVACVAIGLGLLAVLSGIQKTQGLGTSFVACGIALSIVLPILRVLLMAIVFLTKKDYVFGAIAICVLLIIVLGAGIGLEYAEAVL
jgi:uncharacterized membrane protein